jgi:hypothetical protein
MFGAKIFSYGVFVMELYGFKEEAWNEEIAKKKEQFQKLIKQS